MVEAVKNDLEQNWQKIFDSISDLIFVIDKDYRLVKINKAVSDFFKVPPEALLGKKCYEVAHKINRPWLNCPAEKTFADKLPHAEEVNDPNIGVPLLINTFPILDAKGDLTGIIHIAKDISERKQMEDELHKKITILEKFHKVTVDRELKMRELKARIAELEAKLGERHGPETI